MCFELNTTHLRIINLFERLLLLFLVVLYETLLQIAGECGIFGWLFPAILFPLLKVMFTTTFLLRNFPYQKFNFFPEYIPVFIAIVVKQGDFSFRDFIKVFDPLGISVFQFLNFFLSLLFE